MARLDEAEIATSAIADRDLALAVARHKNMFFVERAGGEGVIDYVAAVSGGLQLVPIGEGRTALAKDYDQMVADGLLLEDAESFDSLMERCAAVEARERDRRRKTCVNAVTIVETTCLRRATVFY
jgi:hypothetical protein